MLGGCGQSRTLISVRRQLDLIAFAAQPIRQRQPESGVILDDKDPAFAAPADRYSCRVSFPELATGRYHRKRLFPIRT